MPTRIAITGASGFIFSNVVEYFLKWTDWEITCLCSWRHKGSPLNVPKNDRVKVITHDLSGVIPDIGDFDYIIHAASDSHVDRSIKDPVPFIENNISITLQILEYARKHPPQAFILFSTDEVYGAMEHKEWDILLPSNPYAASKAAQEMIAIAYWKTYQVPVIITNSNNIVGRNQNPEKFVPKLIQLIKAGKEVTIHTSNGKPGKRYWNAVENVADALLFILKQIPAKYSNTIEKIVDRPDKYNLSGGTELDNLEMAELIARKLKRDLKYRLVDVNDIRPGYDEFYAHTEGKLDELGWKAPYTLEESLTWIK